MTTLPPFLYSFIVPIASTAVALMWYHCSSQQRRSKDGANGSSSSDLLPRRASFTSLGLAIGTFPIETKVPEAIINTACYFNDGPPSVEAIATEVVKPLLQNYERMAKVLDVNTGYFQTTALPYEPKDLIRVLQINSPDENLLNQTIFDHLRDSFVKQTALPWWEILVIQNNGAGPSALVIRVHHALADGLSLVHAFSPFLTTKSPKDVISKSNYSRSAVPNRMRISSILEATFHVLTLGASRYDDATAFSKCNHAQMKYSGKRDFVIFPTVPLEFIKRLSSAGNCTVNTILMTAVSQAIREYCISQKDAILVAKGKDVQCRVLIPVGFPRSDTELSDKHTALTNKWCMLSCDMSVGYDDILERLTAIHASTTHIKTSPRAIVQLSIQNTIPPLLPRSLARQAVMDVFSRHSLVLTNVPGPAEACELAGKAVSGVQLFFSNILSQVDLLSYGGQIYGNIVYDPEALPEFKNFGRIYANALVLLAERLSVKPPNSLLDEKKL
jgi:WS/DGAT C-terminal domain/Wax ester synthase-like Acyl-CoA acyltransferase domain